MPSHGESGYRVDRLAHVMEQLRTLRKKALPLGMQEELADDLTTMLHELRTRPLEWGDPERRTRKQGGRVYRALCGSLIVQYAAYEDEPVVLILQIKAMPSSRLA
jgi:hypothetical protein